MHICPSYWGPDSSLLSSLLSSPQLHVPASAGAHGPDLEVPAARLDRRIPRPAARPAAPHPPQPPAALHQEGGPQDSRQAAQAAEYEAERHPPPARPRLDSGGLTQAGASAENRLEKNEEAALLSWETWLKETHLQGQQLLRAQSTEQKIQDVSAK